MQTIVERGGGDLQAGDQDATGSLDALDPCLRSNHVSDQRHMSSRELAQLGERSGRLEDVLLEVAHAKLLGERVGGAFVALRPAALRDPRDHELVHVWTQRLVKSGALQGLLP